MRYVEVEPYYVSDEVLDMINSGEVVVRNIPGKRQTLFVPDTLEVRHFDENGELTGEVIDLINKIG
jgi:hypothetical protein